VVRFHDVHCQPIKHKIHDFNVECKLTSLALSQEGLHFRSQLVMLGAVSSYPGITVKSHGCFFRGEMLFYIDG